MTNKSATGYACTVCFGDPDDPASQAVAAGVILLMAVVGFVLAAIAATGLVWYRRSKKLTGSGRI